MTKSFDIYVTPIGYLCACGTAGVGYSSVTYKHAAAAHGRANHAVWKLITHTQTKDNSNG